MFPKEVKLNSCHLLLAFQAGFFQAIFHGGVMFSFYLQIGSFSPSCRVSAFKKKKQNKKTVPLSILQLY